MRVRIDPVKCRGYGVCEELSRVHFSGDDWGMRQSNGKEVNPEEVASVQSAIDVCPFSAIRWVESRPLPPSESRAPTPPAAVAH